MEDIIIEEMIKLFKHEIVQLKNIMDLNDYDFDPVESMWNAIQRCLGATDLALALCSDNKHGYIKDLFEVLKIEIENIAC